MQNSRYVGSILLLIAIALSGITGCNPAPAKGESSVIRIITPNHHGKVGAQSLPVGRKACYLINITGPSIQSEPSNGCRPELGTMGGFVEGNSTLEVTVPYGSRRKLELYVYLFPGATGDCGALGKTFPASQMSDTYNAGGVSDFDVNSPETNLTVVMNFPGVSSHMMAQYPLSCSGATAAAQNPGFIFGVEYKEETQSTVTLKGRVGRVVDGQDQTLGNIRLQVK